MKPTTNPNTLKLRHLRKIIGHNIRDHRLKHDITLARLSRIANINARRLDMFEMGKEEIELHHLLKISAALKCHIVTLLCEK